MFQRSFALQQRRRCSVAKPKIAPHRRVAQRDATLGKLKRSIHPVRVTSSPRGNADHRYRATTHVGVDALLLLPKVAPLLVELGRGATLGFVTEHRWCKACRSASSQWLESSLAQMKMPNRRYHRPDPLPIIFTLIIPRMIHRSENSTE
jgi:hypothetical protein